MIRKSLCFGLALALAACASDPKPDHPKEDKTPKEAEAKLNTDNLICPQVAIVTRGQEVFDYGGEAPDPKQLVAKARMKNIEGDCAYTKDGVDITFKLHMVAARGPRLGGLQASFPYFVAAVDPSDTIINRETVTASFSFSGGDKTAALDEPLHVFIPLSKDAMQGGPDYRVMVGFKMRKDQGAP